MKRSSLYAGMTIESVGTAIAGEEGFRLWLTRGVGKVFLRYEERAASAATGSCPSREIPRRPTFGAPARARANKSAPAPRTSPLCAAGGVIAGAGWHIGRLDVRGLRRRRQPEPRGRRTRCPTHSGHTAAGRGG